MLMTAIPMNQKSGKNIKVIQYNPPATRNFMYTLWACLLASQVQFFLIAFWTLVCSKTNKYTKKELQCWIAIGLIFRGGGGGWGAGEGARSWLVFPQLLQKLLGFQYPRQTLPNVYG